MSLNLNETKSKAMSNNNFCVLNRQNLRVLNISLTPNEALQLIQTKLAHNQNEDNKNLKLKQLPPEAK